MTDERLVQRWGGTGLLDRVATKDVVAVAKRLDEAAGRALTGANVNAIEEEVLRMRAEGLFGGE